MENEKQDERDALATAGLAWKPGQPFTPDLDDAKQEEKTADWSDDAAKYHKRVTDARTYLLMKHQFFGMIAMKMRFVLTKKVETAAVRADSVCMINPDFMERLDAAELAFVIAHELCHLAYCHFDRLGGRNPQLWNCAGDYMINRMLVKSGLSQPTLDERWSDLPGYDQMVEQAKKAGHNYFGLYNDKYDQWDDEAIYIELREDMKEQMQQQGGGDCCPDCGQPQDQQQGEQQQGQGGQGDDAGDGQNQQGQGGQGDDDQQDGQDGQQQGQGAGGQSDEQQDEQQQGQGGSGQGDDQQDGQQQGQGGSGQGDDQQQGQGGAGGGAGSDTCPTCGQQQDGQQQGQGGQGQQRGGMGTGFGDCDFGATPDLKRRSADGSGERVRTPTEWRQIVLNTASAVKRARGDLPSEIERLVESLRDPQLPWDSILARFMSDMLQSGSSYQRPSRRSGALLHSPAFENADVFPMLPGPRPDRSPVIVAFDTSASRSETELRDDLSETIAILRPYQRPIRVMTCDAEVQFDEYVTDVDEVKMRGGGGTRLEKIFERLEDEPGQFGERPACCIVFTDLATTFPDEEPPYPTIWVYTGYGKPPEVPFGEVIELGPSPSQNLVATRDRLIGQTKQAAQKMAEASRSVGNSRAR